MPKSNFCQPKTDERLDFLREAVDGGMSRNNIKTKELSLKTGINKSTLYKRRKKPETICEHYQISDRTARMIVKELEQERGRYGDYTVLGDGALKRVNFLAFTDYWQFRKMLQDKNARKHVPVYSPQKVARSLGFYGGETYDGSGNPSGN